MRKSSFIIPLLAVVALSASQTSTVFAMVPVMDQGVINLSQSIASNTAEQVTRLNDIQKTTTDILSALGKTGQAQYDLNKNQDWKDFSGGGAFLKTLTQFKPNTCIISGCSSSGSSGSSGSTDFTDLKSARSFIMKNMYASSMPSSVDMDNYRQARLNAEREANVSGYSLALVARQYLADSATRAQKLDSIVNSGTDLRGDLRSNSAVVLAQHEEINGMLAILTSMLERDASSYLASESDFVSSEGGSTPPKVYNQNDHLPDGTRTGVGNSAPATGAGDSVQGSSSSSGSGSLTGSSGSSSGQTILEAGKASSNSGVANAFQTASSTYGGGNSGTLALGAASAAASSDGNMELSQGLSTAASSMNSSGNLSTALMSGATNIADSSGNEQLKWLYDSGSYGLANNDFTSNVNVGGQNQSLVNAMMSVASSLASAKGNYQASSMISQASSAYQNGTINAQQAAMVALNVGAQSSGNTNLQSMIYGVQSAVSGGSAQSVITSTLSNTGSSGSTLANVVNVLSSATW